MTKNTTHSSEPHRDWHKYALGAIMLHHGLLQHDAAALDATLNTSIGEFCGTLINNDLAQTQARWAKCFAYSLTIVLQNWKRGVRALSLSDAAARISQTGPSG